MKGVLCLNCGWHVFEQPPISPGCPECKNPQTLGAEGAPRDVAARFKTSMLFHAGHCGKKYEGDFVVSDEATLRKFHENLEKIDEEMNEFDELYSDLGVELPRLKQRQSTKTVRKPKVMKVDKETPRRKPGRPRKKKD